MTISPELLQLSLLLFNSILAPCALMCVRLLWKMERRLYRVELKLNIATE